MVAKPDRGLRIVAFPFHDWRKGEVEGIRWRDGHLLETFAAHPMVDRVLVVDRPVSLAERLVTRRPPFVGGRRAGRRRQGSRTAQLTDVRPGMTVLDVALPDLLGPVARRRGWWFDVFRDRWVLDAIAWAVDEVVGPSPAAIAWTPTVAPAIERIEPSRLVFDALDNWLIHPTLRQHAELATEGYRRILPRASMVAASAPASKAVLERWAPDVTVVPNGVDPEAFMGEERRPVDLPAAPVVGYAGSLAARVDARLVATVAASMPSVQFVFIGRVMDRRAIAPMRDVPNIHILGNRHYRDLAAYLQHFDIAWIPHAVGPGETGGDPIKLYEYWAAKRQVVATPIDGIAQWAHQLHLVRDAAEARDAIEGLLSGGRRRTPTVVPAERTWTAIAERMIEWLSADDPASPP